jgi:membrane protease subunit HflC
MKRLMTVAGVVVVLALALDSMLFEVNETESAIVTHFGRPVRVVERAGLNWKLPGPVQSVLRLDKRVQFYDPRPSEYLTGDKKNLVVDTYVCWRVADPSHFYQTVRDRLGAEVRLNDLISSEMGAALGNYALSDLISVGPEGTKTAEIMAGVTANCREVASEELGIEVADVKLKRLNFPEQNKQSVFDRMRAERSRIAKQYRAEGQEEALKIRAQADTEKAKILSEAYRDAEMTKGDADAEATRIYAGAHGKDPDFYRFLRTLESYRTFLNDKTTVVLSSDSDLLKLLTSGDAKGVGR